MYKNQCFFILKQCYIELFYRFINRKLQYEVFFCDNYIEIFIIFASNDFLNNLNLTKKMEKKHNYSENLTDKTQFFEEKTPLLTLKTDVFANKSLINEKISYMKPYESVICDVSKGELLSKYSSALDSTVVVKRFNSGKCIIVKLGENDTSGLNKSEELEMILSKMNIFEQKELNGYSLSTLRAMVARFNKKNGRFFSVRKEGFRYFVFENFWRRKTVTHSERMNFGWLHDKLSDLLMDMPLDTDDFDLVDEMDEMDELDNFSDELV